jgi:large subunit ribosomal protein L24
MVSKKAGKQRQAQTDVPIHVCRKRICACLIIDDFEFLVICSVIVRVGDEVEVLRGDFGFPNSVKADSRGKRLGQSRGRSGIKSNVVGVDTKSGFVLVEGVTTSTADGKEEALPIHPSNLIITKLYDGDPLRIKRIVERSNGGAEQ